MKNAMNLGTPLRLGQLAANPATGERGGMYYNTSDVKFKIYENASWVDIVSNVTLESEVANLENLIASMPSKIEWQNSVISATGTPPSSPTDGQRYLIKSPATGAWSGHVDSIAQWDLATLSWVFTAPTLGMFVSVDDQGQIYYYGGSGGWVLQDWENPAWGKGLLLNQSGGAPGILDINVAGTTLDFDGGSGGLKVATNGIGFLQINSDVMGSGIGVNTGTGKYYVDTAYVANTIAGYGLTANAGVLDVNASVLAGKIAINVDGTYLNGDGTSLSPLAVDTSALGGNVAVVVGNGISGDGKTATPLAINLAVNSGLFVDASGLKINENGVTSSMIADATIEVVDLSQNVLTYIAESALFDNVTIGKNGTNELYVKDNAITAIKLAVALNTTDSARDIEISGANGLLVSAEKGIVISNIAGLLSPNVKVSDVIDPTKFSETTYKHGISLSALTTSPIPVLGFDQTVHASEIIEYQLVDNVDSSKIRAGRIYVAASQGIATISDQYVETASVGVSWNANVTGNAVSVSYTTGADDAVMHAQVIKFMKGPTAVPFMSTIPADQVEIIPADTVEVIPAT